MSRHDLSKFAFCASDRKTPTTKQTSSKRLRWRASLPWEKRSDQQTCNVTCCKTEATRGKHTCPHHFLSWELLLVACFFPMCCSCRMLSCCHARIKQIPRNNGKRSTLHPGDTNSHSQPRNTSDNTYWSCSECHALHLPFPSLMLGLPGRMERMEVALVWKCDLLCAIMLCGWFGLVFAKQIMPK